MSKSIRKFVSPDLRAKFWLMRQRFRESIGKKSLKLRLAGSCTVCSGRNISRFRNASVNRLPICFYRCDDCDFIFVTPTSITATMYGDFSTPDLGSETWNEHYLSLIKRHSSTRGKILEIGFGNASFLKLAHEDGWEVHGAELSEPQVRYASDVLQLPNIRRGTLEEIHYPDSFFDVVAGFNFLEHVSDPRQSLAEIRRILRNHGLLVIMCPNLGGVFHSIMPELLGSRDPLKISWCPPDHLSYFNKTNLRMLLERSGFEVLEDASETMSCLWEQFEPHIGPEVTRAKLEKLKTEIAESKLPKGDPRVAEFRERIMQLTSEAMTWRMLTDLMELEPLLGAEVGTLLLSKKR